MNDSNDERSTLLASINRGLESGVISSADLQAIASSGNSQPASTMKATTNLSAVEILFYIAGSIIYATILSLIVLQGGTLIFDLSVSAGSALGIWALAYFLLRQPSTSESRINLANALQLTGSLLLITAGIIVLREVEFDTAASSMLAVGAVFAAIGIIHLVYDRALAHRVIVLIGIMLLAIAYAFLLLGLVEFLQPAADVYGLVIVSAAAVLTVMMHFYAKLRSPHAQLASVYDGLAVFIALATFYILSYVSTIDILWQVILFTAIICLFYLSIVLRKQVFLGVASLFLVIGVISLSFRYFSDLGVTFSLIVSATSILGVAIAASHINKAYIRSEPHEQKA